MPDEIVFRFGTAFRRGNLRAYGVTISEKEDIMGAGSVRHPWHAAPWQEAAAALTGTKKTDWGVSMGPLKPVRLPPGPPIAGLPKIRTL
jgi:hypothetical protein